MKAKERMARVVMAQTMRMAMVVTTMAMVARMKMTTTMVNSKAVT